MTLWKHTNFKTLDTLPRETNDTNFPNLLVYASKKIMTLGKENGDKMWPIATIHGICSKTWGTGRESNGEYIRNTILNIIGNKWEDKNLWT